MNTKTKSTIFRILYILLIIATILFIFSNSLDSKDESSLKSSGVHEIINNVLKFLHSPFLLSEYFVRKAAHFTEFFILGSLLFGYTALEKKVVFQNEIYACFISCIVAMTDETIQYFSNRGSMLLDVWLDFSAATIAIIFFYCIYILRKKKIDLALKRGE